MLFRQIYNIPKLRRNIWKDISKLENLQFKKLKSIVRYAYQNTRFYHNLYKKNNIDPYNIKNWEDFKKLPIIYKKDIQDGYKSGTIISKDVDLTKCSIFHTAGSSGFPLSIAFKPKELDFSFAVHLRALMENGLKLRDKNLSVSTNPPKKKSFIEKMGFLRHVYISLYDNPVEKKEWLNSAKINSIFGHTSYVKLLAKTKKDYDLKNFNPRIIFTSAELLDRETRKLIQDSFNGEVFDLYGCVEFNRTAWECNEHIGYHIDMDSVALELVQNNDVVNSGEPGEVVYTGLFNYTMPLIRYNIEDLAVKTDEICPCGRKLPLLKEIKGRIFDCISLPNGNIFSPLIFINSLRAIDGIDEFNVIQENINLIKILYVKNKRLKNEKLDSKIEIEIQKILGKDISVEPIEVDEITRGESVKWRAIRSKVKIDWKKIIK